MWIVNVASNQACESDSLYPFCVRGSLCVCVAGGEMWHLVRLNTYTTRTYDVCVRARVCACHIMRMCTRLCACALVLDLSLHTCVLTLCSGSGGSNKNRKWVTTNKQQRHLSTLYIKHILEPLEGTIVIFSMRTRWWSYAYQKRRGGGVRWRGVCSCE